MQSQNCTVSWFFMLFFRPDERDIIGTAIDAVKACAQHTACKAAVGLGAASIAGEAAIKKASEWMIEHVWGKRDLKDLGETHNWVRDNTYVENFFRTDHGHTFFPKFYISTVDLSWMSYELQ